MTRLFWTFLFLILVVCAFIAVNLYLILRKNDKVKYITSSYVLSKEDLGKSLIVQPKDVRITVPRECINWNGVITVENFSDVTNTLDIAVSSYIVIVEYNNTVTDYDQSTPINGTVWHYINKQGTVNLNNYIAELKFDVRATSINIRTVIADSQSF